MEEKKYIVYLHVNRINGKVYVGITSMEPELRWRDGKGYRHNIYFAKAVNRYGWDNFEHIIIFRNIPKDLACREEILLIKRFRKRNKCYNIANGGEGTQAFPEEAKEKLRKYIGPLASQYGKRHTLEQRAHQSKVMKKLWKIQREQRLHMLLTRMIKKGSENGMYGKRPSDKCINKIKEVCSKPVQMLDKSTGHVLKEFSSAIEAERFLNKKGHHISCCCNGKRKTAYGYKWRYKNTEGR